MHVKVNTNLHLYALVNVNTEIQMYRKVNENTYIDAGVRLKKHYHEALSELHDCVEEEDGNKGEIHGRWDGASSQRNVGQ